MLLSHTSGGHGPELEISQCDDWDTLWRGSHHMIMVAIAFSSTTHAVIPLVGGHHPESPGNGVQAGSIISVFQLALVGPSLF
jgi:hypothetical protein